MGVAARAALAIVGVATRAALAIVGVAEREDPGRVGVFMCCALVAMFLLLE